ncbi:putative MFS monocarboxylate transporter [Lentithecium fluviatile CBS 122367]|uniref:Putative MFS monocarboxylate transporter n=1 Tax=Lentithecium fluviatile CBS 122367 TaxID=1168545 RepID=A0A6G1JIA3_9PLEO|nr:putative MFS monocarboxylate transporter [Lentithecium fluviatile CBS 122367]
MATEVQPSIELDSANPFRRPSASTTREGTWHNATPTDTEIEQAPLPPTDTGKAAWLVLAASSLIQAPVWGFSSAFGVLQEYYSRHPEKLDGDVGNVAVVGTTVTGIMYLISPFTFALLTRWPRLRRWCGPIGLVFAAVGFLLSSFATQVWHLIVTQGVMSALGCGLLFTPTTLYLDEWFVKRKGLAYGVMWAGKSMTGVVLPFAMEASLRHFGPAITLRAWSVITVLTSAPLVHFLRPRIPLPSTSTPRPISTAFLHLRTFWMLQAGNILQSLGYFLPYAYISSYTVQHLHLTPTNGTLVLALINTTSIPGGIVIGGLGDHFSVTTTILISTLGSALAVFLFWGLSEHIALLVVFAITYGFFAGGFSSTWSGVLTEVKGQAPSVDTGFLFGLLAGGRGIGNVISGPLSVALVTREGWLRDGRAWGVGGEYGGIILFTGTTAVLGGWGALGRLWR